MATRKMVYFPDDPLTKKAAPVDTFDEDLATLADDMFDTMSVHQGVGLAAPQVGVAKRLFVFQAPDGPEVCLVNPELVEMEGREEGEEGCLSMPQLYAMVPRATRVAVRAQDIDGNPLEFEAADFVARVIQHEYDHLEGILFPERLDIISRQAILEDWAAIRERLLRGEIPEPTPRHAR